jgi:hypothetical protein
LSGHSKVPAGALSARPLTSKDALLDVGLACLSPGFNTSNPQMQQQLQRSLDVREQQRLIIEARQKGEKIPDFQPPKTGTDSLFRPNKIPQTGRRKGPPPALSIAAPHHSVFANERVIQSAPLGASFTGLRRNPEGPLSRQVVNQPSNLSHASHIHHTPAIQTANRLPPIGDIFPSELQSNGQMRNGPTNYTLSPGQSHQPLASPGYPPHFQQQQKVHQDAAAVAAQQKHLQSQLQAAQKSAQSQSERPREYKSAEEAVRALVGGRDELLPRLVHYGGHQPPTPPSPANKHAGLGLQSEQQSRTSSSGGGARRRDREEYEADVGSPPLGRQAKRPGPFGTGRDSPQSVAAKKEQFMKLMEQAWDLFHS